MGLKGEYKVLVYALVEGSFLRMRTPHCSVYAQGYNWKGIICKQIGGLLQQIRGLNLF